MTGGGLYKPRHRVGQRVSALYDNSKYGTSLANGEVVAVAPASGMTGEYRVTVRLDGHEPGKTYEYVMPASGTSDYIGEPFPVSKSIRSNSEGIPESFDD